MNNRQNDTLINEALDLIDFFNNPKSQRQKQYEAVRAVIIDKLPVDVVSKKFGYKTNTIYSLIKDAKKGNLSLFPKISKGPKCRRTQDTIQEEIIQLRKKNMYTKDIHELFIEQNKSISIRTIERIIKDAGFEKLRRRTNIELGITKKKTIIGDRSLPLDIDSLPPFRINCCPAAAVFCFIPYIIESGIIDIVEKCNLPESSEINSTQACLSMLLLKLIGNHRLSQMDAYDHEPGLGIFAGLNVLPKSTYMSTYSCLTSESVLLDFQQRIIKRFKKIYPDFYRSGFINLDFHSIPHYGEQAEMERVWCGARGKSMRGANTVFAQDSQSNAILYTRADILRREESKEIKNFISYWRKVNGDLNETLVFDCKFTKYKVLDELSEDGIKFITLRKRSQKLINETLNIPLENWEKIRLPILKRKHKKISVYEMEVKLKGCKNSFRQIVIKDHGRKQPTFIITNRWDLSLSIIIEVYAKRWHIENKLAELVAFFNLNALSSPIMIRIHFDILWMFIADTLYRRLAQDLRRFDKNLAPTIFRKFINFSGNIVYDGDILEIKIRKKAHTPVWKNVKKLEKPFQVPWLRNKTMQIVWTP